MYLSISIDDSTVFIQLVSLMTYMLVFLTQHKGFYIEHRNHSAHGGPSCQQPGRELL